MAAAKKRAAPAKPAPEAPPKTAAQATEPWLHAMINMAIGIAVVAVMGWIVISMIRMIGG